MSFSKIDPDNLQALYDEWSQSDETQRAFLKRKELSFSVFNNNYGLFQSRKDKKKQQPAVRQLLPVHVVQEPVKQSPQVSKLLVQFSNGSSLHFSTDVPADYVGSLLASIESRPLC